MPADCRGAQATATGTLNMREVFELLPARLPMLLLNGASGVAVGTTTIKASTNGKTGTATLNGKRAAGACPTPCLIQFWARVDGFALDQGEWLSLATFTPDPLMPGLAPRLGQAVEVRRVLGGEVLQSQLGVLHRQEPGAAGEPRQPRLPRRPPLRPHRPAARALVCGPWP